MKIKITSQSKFYMSIKKSVSKLLAKKMQEHFRN